MVDASDHTINELYLWCMGAWMVQKYALFLTVIDIIYFINRIDNWNFTFN